MIWQLIYICNLSVLLSFHNSTALLIFLVVLHMLVAINYFGKSSEIKFLIKERKTYSNIIEQLQGKKILKTELKHRNVGLFIYFGGVAQMLTRSEKYLDTLENRRWWKKMWRFRQFWLLMSVNSLELLSVCSRNCTRMGAHYLMCLPIAHFACFCCSTFMVHGSSWSSWQTGMWHRVHRDWGTFWTQLA